MTKVLIAEDDIALANMYKMKLEDEGFSVVCAGDGEEAVSKCKEEKPDIVLMDVMMPKKEGTEALIELKKHPGTKSIPVIFLTNLGGRIEDTKAAQDLGAEDLLVKSMVTPKDIIDKIKQVLSRQSN